MKQKNCVKFESEDKKISFYAESDSSLGAIHDFLLHIKGQVVDRILSAQKEETKAANAPKEEKKDEKLKDMLEIPKLEEKK